MDEPCEAVWQSALGCLLHLITHAGHWVASSCSQLPPAAAAALLDACVTFHWSQELHARLVQMAVNLLYLSDHGTGGQQHGGVHAERSFGSQAQQPWRQQQQQHKGGWAGGKGFKAAWDGSAAALTSPEDVSVTLNTLGSKGQQPQQQEVLGVDTPPQLATQRRNARPGSEADADASDAGSTAQHSSSSGRDARSQLGDFDLPWQLHAGPVDEQQLAAFGGPAKLLQHFCHAGSIEAQRTLLVPLLQVFMPQDESDTAQLAVLQALCARPSCLAALQVAVTAGLPGWSDCVLQAVRQQLGHEGLDVPLLSCLLSRLERLSMQRTAVPADPTAVAAPSRSDCNSGDVDSEQRQEQQQQKVRRQLPPDVQLAMQVTLQQLRGELPSRQQSRPGLQPTDIAAYQVGFICLVAAKS